MNALNIVSHENNPTRTQVVETIQGRRREPLSFQTEQGPRMVETLVILNGPELTFSGKCDGDFVSVTYDAQNQAGTIKVVPQPLFEAM